MTCLAIFTTIIIGGHRALAWVLFIETCGLIFTHPTGTTKENYLALPLDVTSTDAITSAIAKAKETFGRLDVVVNNAFVFSISESIQRVTRANLIYCSGYGLSGEFESLSETQIRRQMEVNFFGLIAVTKAAMAAMREQKPSGGLIQQVTSIGGQRGVPVSSSSVAI